MKGMLKDTAILFAITLISGLILGAVYQLTKDLSMEEIENSGFGPYYIDHTTALWPQAAGGVPGAVIRGVLEATAERSGKKRCRRFFRIPRTGREIGVKEEGIPFFFRDHPGAASGKIPDVFRKKLGGIEQDKAGISRHVKASLRDAGKDGPLQRALIPCSLVFHLGMTFALRIMSQRLGDELCFLPPHAVKDVHRRLLLRVIHIETNGEPAGLHFIGHGDHLPPETA